MLFDNIVSESGERLAALKNFLNYYSTETIRLLRGALSPRLYKFLCHGYN